jgi:hypothetical protein
MKTISPKKHWFFVIPCFVLFSFAGCSKSSDTTNQTTTDLGYGCATSVVLQTISGSAGVLYYNPYQAKWDINFDLPGGIYITCEVCDNSTIKAITDLHSQTEIVNVTVSGQIKRRIAYQVPLTPGAGYREIYVMNVTAINE